MAYIYKIENDINKKVYIGKTENSLNKRFQEHCRDARKNTEEHRPLYAAMKKYGEEHFHISLIEETDNPNERERYWIETLGTFKDGYNATLGGDGASYIDYDLVISTYRQTKNQEKTAQILGINSTTVRKIIHNYIPNEVLTQVEFTQQFLRRKVAKIDIKTNEVLAVYASVSEAERKNGISRHIGAVCNGKRKTAGGYKWMYI